MESSTLFFENWTFYKCPKSILQKKFHPHFFAISDSQHYDLIEIHEISVVTIRFFDKRNSQYSFSNIVDSFSNIDVLNYKNFIVTALSMLTFCRLFV